MGKTSKTLENTYMAQEIPLKIYTANQGGIVGRPYIAVLPGYNTPYGMTEVTNFEDLKEVARRSLAYYPEYISLLTERYGPNGSDTQRVKREYEQLGGDQLMQRIIAGDVSAIQQALSYTINSNDPSAISAQNSAIAALKSGTAAPSGYVVDPKTGAMTLKSSVDQEAYWEAEVAAGRAKKVPVGNGFGYVPTGSPADVQMQGGDPLNTKYSDPKFQSMADAEKARLATQAQQAPSGGLQYQQPNQASGSMSAQSAQVTPTSLIAGPIDLSRGNQFFVRFPQTRGNTVYLYDKDRQIYTPFTSAAGFQAFTGKTPEQLMAEGGIYDITEQNKPAGTFIPDQYGFDDTGNVRDYNYFSQYQPGVNNAIGNAYGKQKQPELERQAADYLGQLFLTLKSQGAVSQQTFDAYITNPTNVAKYINAWLYGGYSADDIFRDIKAKELNIPGNVVDPTKTAQQMAQEASYASFKGNQSLNPPANLNIPSSFWSLPIHQIPNDAFKTLVPVIDVNSPAFKEEASKLQDAYYDLLIQQVEAKTDQDKAIADDNYRLWKTDIERRYGLQLADSAGNAWDQIRSLFNPSINAGTLNTGIYNEAIDRLLASQRRIDQRLRDSKVTEEEQKKREYYLNSATADQIKNDLTPEERQRWGLVPDQELTTWLGQLKTQYPDLTDQDIQRIKDSFVDQNGNLRSTMYKQLYANKYNYGQQKQIANENTLLQKKLDETEKAYAPYTQTDNPFIRYEQSFNPTDPAFQAPQTTQTGQTTTPNNTGLQMPTQTANDYSNRYGLYNGTVYNLDTGFGYTNPQDFFRESGLSSFDGVKLKTDYTPKFYKYNDSPTVYNAYNNKALNSQDEYYRSGGNKDWSGIEIRSR